MTLKMSKNKGLFLTEICNWNPEAVPHVQCLKFPIA